MTADGNWDLVVTTPLGSGAAFISRLRQCATRQPDADTNSIEIFDGVIDGAALSWKVSITDPMPMIFSEFSGAIEGNRLSAQ